MKKVKFDLNNQDKNPMEQAQMNGLLESLGVLSRPSIYLDDSADPQIKKERFSIDDFEEYGDKEQLDSD